jgi:hypothetical protein
MAFFIVVAEHACWSWQTLVPFVGLITLQDLEKELIVKREQVEILRKEILRFQQFLAEMQQRLPHLRSDMPSDDMCKISVNTLTQGAMIELFLFVSPSLSHSPSSACPLHLRFASLAHRLICWLHAVAPDGPLTRK